MHRAARIEDAVHEFREKRARARGLVPTIIPFTGYGSTTWVRVLGRVVLTRLPKSAPPEDSREAKRIAKRGTSIRGWRSFVSVPVNSVNVSIQVGGTTHLVQADRGGVVDAVIQTSLEPGWQSITLQATGSAEVTAPVYIVNPDSRFGVVSDVDDTVMVTALPRPLLAAWNTFVLDEHARVPTPGIAVFLSELARKDEGTPVIYLSTGAWNVAPTLTRFLSRNLYPPGPLLLTDWGPTHDRWFRSGRDHKRQNLQRLADEFPEIQWLLLGDDGQHDEAIYAEFQDNNPGQVAAVAIRQLSSGEAVLAGGRSAKDAASLEHGEVPWIYSPDGAGLLEQLHSTGF